jgi:hypothetical protein
LTPDISEFSFGYALTEELVNRPGLAITAAPLFPSLLAEGQSGGGYDVHLPFAGFPVYLQFKLSHCMVKQSAHECQIGLLRPNFYRMHLRPLRHSRQHDLLLDLEGKGHAVYYAAPHFHLPEELNEAYITGNVVNRCLFVKPSEIGTLPDDRDHHISFKAGYPAYLFSEPRVIRGASKFREDFDNDLLEGFSRYPIIDGSRDSLSALANDLFACIETRIYQFEWRQPEAIRRLAQREPRLQIGYIARTFFGCDILLVRPKERYDA